MSAVSIPWAILNLNGKTIHKTARTYVRCEWKGAGCYLTIMAQDMPPIGLQVELDVISMAFSVPGTRHGVACIILNVALNRDEPWAENRGKTWIGDIGIHFAPDRPPWDLDSYKNLIKSLSSCFYPPDISEKSDVEIQEAWDKIGKDDVIPGRIAQFHDLSYESLTRLRPKGWLNGELVMTGLREWCIDMANEQNPPHQKVLLMPEFFFRKLTEQGVASVASWTKKDTKAGHVRDINIFEYGYIAVAINWEKYKLFAHHVTCLTVGICSNHWILALIVDPIRAQQPNGDPCIIAVLDSIADHKSVAHINHHLRLWMHHEANNPTEHGLNIKTIPVKVPQQPNGYDCGIYVIHFARTFFSDVNAYTNHIQSNLNTSQAKKVWRAEQISSLRDDFLTFIQSKFFAAM